MLEFVNFLNAKLVNLKYLVINSKDNLYDKTFKEDRKLDISSEFTENFINYEKNLTAYNGRAMLTLIHTYQIALQFRSRKAAEKYFEQQEIDFSGFGCSSKIRNKSMVYNYKKINDAKENLELVIRLKWMYKENIRYKYLHDAKDNNNCEYHDNCEINESCLKIFESQ